MWNGKDNNSFTSNIPGHRKHAVLQILSDLINYHWKLILIQNSTKYPKKDAVKGQVPVHFTSGLLYVEIGMVFKVEDYEIISGEWNRSIIFESEKQILINGDPVIISLRCLKNGHVRFFIFPGFPELILHPHVGFYESVSCKHIHSIFIYLSIMFSY